MRSSQKVTNFCKQWIVAHFANVRHIHLVRMALPPSSTDRDKYRLAVPCPVGNCSLGFDLITRIDNCIDSFWQQSQP